MKKVITLFAAVVMIASFSNTVMAQVPAVSNGASAIATGTATIISPITITKNVDMNFGNVAVQALTGGTVLLSPSATPTRTATSGVSLPATMGTVSAAKFTVTGTANFTYAIGLQTAAVAFTGSTTMTIDTFTSLPSGSSIITTGDNIIYVGALLHVGAGETAGTYLSASPFTVMVNYN